MAALTCDGELYGWGKSCYGELGIMSEGGISTPMKVVLPGAQKVTAVFPGVHQVRPCSQKDLVGVLQPLVVCPSDPVPAADAVQLCSQPPPAAILHSRLRVHLPTPEPPTWPALLQRRFPPAPPGRHVSGGRVHAAGSTQHPEAPGEWVWSTHVGAWPTRSGCGPYTGLSLSVLPLVCSALSCTRPSMRGSHRQSWGCPQALHC